MGAEQQATVELKEIKRIYFLGIGGIGMSALARYFNVKGVAVSGYDKTEMFIQSLEERHLLEKKLESIVHQTEEAKRQLEIEKLKLIKEKKI